MTTENSTKTDTDDGLTDVAAVDLQPGDVIALYRSDRRITTVRRTRNLKTVVIDTVDAINGRDPLSHTLTGSVVLAVVRSA